MHYTHSACIYVCIYSPVRIGIDGKDRLLLLGCSSIATVFESNYECSRKNDLRISNQIPSIQDLEKKEEKEKSNENFRVVCSATKAFFTLFHTCNAVNK